MLYGDYLKDYKVDEQYDLIPQERLGEDGIAPPERKEFLAQLERSSGNIFNRQVVGPFSGDGPRTISDSNSTENTHISINTDRITNGRISGETKNGTIEFKSSTTEVDFFVSYALLK